MEKMFEFRWHGSGRQGIVTTARLLAEAAITRGHYTQDSPEFGPEHRGAPARGASPGSIPPLFVLITRLAIQMW